LNKEWSQLQKTDKYEIISEIAKRRGFFWPSYEIYGGVSGFMTYGPLGSILKRRIETKFRQFFIEPLHIFEIESSIVTPGKVFEASGHVKAFREPMVQCKKCKKKFRADHLLQEQVGMSDTETEKLGLHEIADEIQQNTIKCPECEGKLQHPKYFMTMFTTTIGPYSESVGYGRPEAAQGIFVEFKRLYAVTREKLPFGVVQIGHALRNEISPRQGPIRLREFTIADIEFFFDPEESQCSMLAEVEEDILHLLPAVNKLKGVEETINIKVREALQKNFIKEEWQAFFMALAKRFLNELGIPDDKQRFVEKLEWERAHYSSQGYDQEIFLDRWGWTEVSGHNCRTNYDLEQHMNHSGVDLQVFKEYEKPIRNEKLVVEPVPSEIGPIFKKDSSKVVAALMDAVVKDVDSSLKENGFFMAGPFKILPKHVKIVRRVSEERGRRFIPHVIEPSFGLDRLVYAALEHAYNKRDDRNILMLPRELAPLQVGVFPLVTKDGLPKKAHAVQKTLREAGFHVEYDEAGAIGRRYARADEAGTPLCITIDYQTLKDDTITIRDRDSWKQIRVKLEKMPQQICKYFLHKNDFTHINSKNACQ
jgi:glycyl-tRNA synthetase